MSVKWLTYALIAVSALNTAIMILRLWQGDLFDAVINAVIAGYAGGWALRPIKVPK